MIDPGASEATIGVAGRTSRATIAAGAAESREAATITAEAATGPETTPEAARAAAIAMGGASGRTADGTEGTATPAVAVAAGRAQAVAGHPDRVAPAMADHPIQPATPAAAITLAATSVTTLQPAPAGNRAVVRDRVNRPNRPKPATEAAALDLTAGRALAQTERRDRDRDRDPAPAPAPAMILPAAPEPKLP